MAKIQITEVPEAPKGDAIYLGQAAGGQLSMPGTRYQEATNFERHIPGLMQSEISGAPYANLARANAGIGAAIAGAGQNLAGEIGQLFEGMQKAKDMADLSFAENTMRMSHATFAERVAQEQIPPAQQLQLWDQEYYPQIQANLQSRKLSPHILAEVAPDLDFFHRRTRTGIIEEGNALSRKSWTAEIETQIESEVQAGRTPEALAANRRMTIAGLQTEGQEKDREKDIRDAGTTFAFNQVLEDNPRAALSEIDEINETGDSDVFPIKEYPALQNPALRNTLRKNAKTLIDDLSVDALQEIEDLRKAGKLTKPEDIDRINGAHKDILTTDKTLALKNQLLHDPVYDKEAVVRMQTKVLSIDFNIETDEGMRKFNDLHEEIGTAVPSHLQGPLRSKLHQEYARQREGKPKDTRTKLKSAIEGEILKFADIGAFDPKGYDSVKAGKDPEYRLEHREQRLEVFTKVENYQEQISKWIDDHPEKTTTDAIQYMDDLISEDLRDHHSKNFDKQKEESKQTLQNRARIDRMGGSQQQAPARATTDQMLEKSAPRYEFGGGMAATAPINNDLVSKVKTLEGFAPQSQWDFKQWSVGYGTRGKKGESLTPQQAEMRLRSELAMHAGNIDDAAADVKLRLTPGQRNALISFDFNTGKGAYLIRTSKGDTEEILRRLKLYVKADGKTLQGLVNRRNAEAEMFMT